MKRAYVMLAPVAGALVATAVVASTVYYMHSADTVLISSFLFSVLALITYARGHPTLATAFAVSAVLLAIYPFMQKPEDMIETFLGAGIAVVNDKAYILGMNALGLVFTALPILLLLAGLKH